MHRGRQRQSRQLLQNAAQAAMLTHHSGDPCCTILDVANKEGLAGINCLIDVEEVLRKSRRTSDHGHSLEGSHGEVLRSSQAWTARVNSGVEWPERGTGASPGDRIDSGERMVSVASRLMGI
jgi:hypothetical protein